MDLGIDVTTSAFALLGAALVAGGTSSLHCFAMCGPLAAAGCVSGEKKGRSVIAYQSARVLAYTLGGAILGALGGGVFSVFSLHPPAWIAFVTAGLLVISALGLGERLPKVPGAAQIVRLGVRTGAKVSPPAKSGLLGLVTPLLPCGLAFGVFATALVAGSALHGALVAGGFALGSGPALVLAQLQATWLARLPRGPAFVLRRVVPLVAAGVLVWRAFAVPAAGSCCH